MTDEKMSTERQIKRNPHPDFKKVEASRPAFSGNPTDNSFTYYKTPKPDWKPGSGANSDVWKKHKKVYLDPFAENRLPVDNYKLLTSAITPRPIGLISTFSENTTDPSKITKNLSPFSYFQLVNHDPPIFVIGFSGGGETNCKDTCKNILETGECTINIISEWFIEAANFSCTTAPPEVDEWKLTGLTPLSSKLVKSEHVAESGFSIECKLIDSKVWKSRQYKTDDGNAQISGTLCILEGVMFHVREDFINEAKNDVDIGLLKPVARLGGTTYSRVTEGLELLRPDFEQDVRLNETVKKKKLVD